ncbi:MAG: bifunctional phosphoribosylaminoimidazolecarboxamide formyltransferase/IMP cyclohydrolase [Gemmatimonadales bacterium]|nr:bifunctional phosphoribosylaminoimidazolecarboxamide formyltransferase/IMP cyclohydrolase [Gemmatimonadales bacterium]
MPRALISVSDKRGVVAFARALAEQGWEVVSTGGTAATIAGAGVPVRTVESVTGVAEFLDGRVKTLHPAIHGGLLARRDVPDHMASLAAHGITPFDLVAINLYPFRETVAKPGVSDEDAIENIDIGGPAMLRAAAKNHRFVVPVVDPTDYDAVLALLRQGAVPERVRRDLAAKVFGHLADYDAAVAAYLTGAEDVLPPRLAVTMERLQALRYGENPQQRAALYVTGEPRGMRDLAQRQGKELSFNNLLDVDAASAALAPWPGTPACAIVKHTNPCGIALGRTAEDAFLRARATDPKSAFGSVVAFNTVVTAAAAAAMADLFVEVVVAPSFHDEALAAFATRSQLRVIELPVDRPGGGLDFKRVRGGFLVQDRFTPPLDETGWTVPTERQPTPAEWQDLRFAWGAIAAVKSNAILLAHDDAAIGIGAGQMSRVDAVHLAIHKAREAGHALAGCVLASDAFFPFADGIELAAAAGVAAIIQPGGSIRDAEVLAAAGRLGLAMVLTGARQFRH